MKTAASNKKIREIITLVSEGRLVPQPDFQRRLIWNRDNKNFFLDSILKGFPFPEIYIADGDVDLETGQGSQLLVDGLQRVSTIIQYFNGDSDLRLTTVIPYRELSDEDKKRFLQYDVAVRDLGTLNRHEIIEVFQRLNATKYSLLDIEVNNAVYGGAMKKYAETLATMGFFVDNNVFSASDFKRMGDLRYAILIITTMIAGYFNRDDVFQDMLSTYNDDFPMEKDIAGRISNVIAFIEECGFPKSSRLWRKADLFSAMIEFDRILNVEDVPIGVAETVDRLQSFYEQIGDDSIVGNTVPSIYYKAALQASNDRVNRVRRGLIVYGVISGMSHDAIMMTLREGGVA